MILGLLNRFCMKRKSEVSGTFYPFLNFLSKINIANYKMLLLLSEFCMKFIMQVFFFLFISMLNSMSSYMPVIKNN